jgi:phosphoglycolate phosphatase
VTDPIRLPPPLDPTSIRGIVFDLDGTLVDSYRPITGALNHARAGFDLDPLPLEEVRRRVGRGLEVLIAELVGPSLVAEGVRLFRERYAEIFAEQTSALPGVMETVRELSEAGYRMAVASNKPARFGTAILESLGMREFFRSIRGPDGTATPKPDPTMIRLCLQDLQIARTEAVYVGDMVLDVESAARAGLPVILIGGGSSTIEELAGTGQRVIESLRDLRRVLPERPTPA